MFKIVWIAAASLVALPLSLARAENMKVVASFSIIADLAKNVGGGRVEITTLVRPGSDAHVYEPTPADAVAMVGADIVLVNGLHFEGFLQRLVESSGSTAPVVELTRGVEVLPANHGHEHGEALEHDAEANESGGMSDPHAWQSIDNAAIYIRNIATAFCAADAAGCPEYQANAQAYRTKLDVLNQEVEAAIASIPEDKRTIITSHDAFGYFEHEYGIRFLAPEGVSTEAEASAADVAALIRQVRTDHASAIFVESISDPRLAERIASETGLRIGGSLFSDSLSDASGPAATYIDMMRHNASIIKGAILGR